MREIKFRAWDGCKMYTNIYSILIGNGKVTQIMDADYEDVEDITVMQYTGLKDKNGKEIYEGDIVQEDHQTAIVMWYKDDACFGIRSIGKYKFDYAFKDTAPKNKEIVGNIHENPELLEVMK